MSAGQENTLKVGHQAFERLQHGLTTADWTPMLDLLTEDFTFWFPVGAYHGLNVGKERAQAFFQHVSEVFGKTIKVTSLERVTSNETTIVFEFRDEGMMFDTPYANRIAVSFDVRGDKICGYREYFGSDGKSN
ncbi:nuclear transport factor 2 family protein [Chamaesiphon minutus]|uniref:Ketosteroid isomerase-like protein n=1 Tax=Chamaesiphon minutus (strain ATCC 27169 / PCC 6605) TaxID=1173020 RepID=K9U9F2_CHAP6|nr:nuclear transport factor 2 family protein [Chamaesiphon minutus]AFY91727.1 ketosteroid isomerase-like protein [Chamaesiphon minutus PCC 6605]